MIIDGCGRHITYLRVSLTDKCNLRCKYCVPPEGVKMLDHADILTHEEMLRIISILVSLGVNKVRFTGGEPLVRKGAMNLIHNVSLLQDAPKLCITTNGVMLASYLPELLDAGVSDINISLDTLRGFVYEKITGSAELDNVLKAIDACYDAGVNLKINAVPLKGINEEDIPALAALARDRMIDVRFIELMPIGCASCCEGISNAEVKTMLTSVYGDCVSSEDGNAGGPAEYVSFEGFKGRVGFISPMTHAFCSGCNRIRLTCDGMLKLCLASPECLDVKTLIRSGKTDEQTAEEIKNAVLRKPAKHGLKFTDGRNMIGIGG
ncbi:MAG: GTP 3',8-cyclase MoaA [Clostridiales bacterium]|nr:GTP 3',8-cyclase MoaA [Clostridiales bacterium]